MSSCTKRLHSAWVRSKSGSKNLAIKRAQYWEETVICLAWLVGRLLTGLRVGSPGPSCVSHLRHSDQQLSSCWQGAHQTLTPLLSCWVASGTWSRERKKKKTKTRTKLLVDHLQPLETSPSPGCSKALVMMGEARDTVSFSFPF